MKNVPVQVAAFNTYLLAADYARALANLFCEPVHVRRRGVRWFVFANSKVADKLIEEMIASERALDHSASEYDDSDQSEVYAELAADQQAWADSNEEGWFYPDDGDQS